MLSSLFLSNFHPVVPTQRRRKEVQKKKKATSYCIRFGHSLQSANQLLAQEVNSL